MSNNEEDFGFYIENKPGKSLQQCVKSETINERESYINLFKYILHREPPELLIRDKDEILSTLEDISNDEEVNVRADLCEKLIQVLYYLLELETIIFKSFGRFLLDKILLITLKSLSDDMKVRKNANKNLLYLIEKGFLDNNILTQSVTPAIVELCNIEVTIENADIITSAIAIMAKVAPLIGKDYTYPMLYEKFIQLSMGDTHFVRKQCATIFPVMCEVLGHEICEEKMLPVFLKLCNDQIWGVRKACAQVMPMMALVCSLEARRKILVPALKKFMFDSSKWVIMAALKGLGQFLASFAEPQIIGLAYSYNLELFITNAADDEFRQQTETDAFLYSNQPNPAVIFNNYEQYKRKFEESLVLTEKSSRNSGGGGGAVASDVAQSTGTNTNDADNTTTATTTQQSLPSANSNILGTTAVAGTTTTSASSNQLQQQVSVTESTTSSNGNDEKFCIYSYLTSILHLDDLDRPSSENFLSLNRKSGVRLSTSSESEFPYKFYCYSRNNLDISTTSLSSESSTASIDQFYNPTDESDPLYKFFKFCAPLKNNFLDLTDTVEGSYNPYIDLGLHEFVQSLNMDHRMDSYLFSDDNKSGRGGASGSLAALNNQPPPPPPPPEEESDNETAANVSLPPPPMADASDNENNNNNNNNSASTTTTTNSNFDTNKKNCDNNLKLDEIKLDNNNRENDVNAEGEGGGLSQPQQQQQQDNKKMRNNDYDGGDEDFEKEKRQEAALLPADESNNNNNNINSINNNCNNDINKKLVDSIDNLQIYDALPDYNDVVKNNNLNNNISIINNTNDVQQQQQQQLVSGSNNNNSSSNSEDDDFEKYNSHQYWYISPDMPIELTDEDMSLCGTTNSDGMTMMQATGLDDCNNSNNNNYNNNNSSSNNNNNNNNSLGDICDATKDDDNISNQSTFIMNETVTNSNSIFALKSTAGNKLNAQNETAKRTNLVAENEEVEWSLLEDFVYMKDIDDDLCSQFAYDFPAVMLTLGKRFWPLMRQHFIALCNDVSCEIRKTSAKSIIQIALIIGRKQSTKDLVTPYIEFFKDVDEIKIEVIKNLADFIRIVELTEHELLINQLGFCLLPPLNQADWRFRESIALQIQEILKIQMTIEKRNCLPYFTGMSLKFMTDKYDSVRRAGIDSFIACCKQQPTKNQFLTVIKFLCNNFAAKKSNWRRRQTFIVTVDKMMIQSIMGADVIEEHEILNYLLDFSDDEIPNVRIYAAKCLSQTLLPIYTQNERDESAKYLLMIKQAILRLQDDCDRDVRDNSACIVTGDRGVTHIQSNTSISDINIIQSNNSDGETEGSGDQQQQLPRTDCSYAHPYGRPQQQQQTGALGMDQVMDESEGCAEGGVGAGGEGDNELKLRQNEINNKMELKIE